MGLRVLGFIFCVYKGFWVWGLRVLGFRVLEGFKCLRVLGF